ncbi:MAG: HAD family phosphatase [Bryobacteraceae bacterium]
MPAPKALIFDLGGVIVPLDFPRGYRALEAASGVPAAEIPKRIGATDLVKRFETGQMAAADFTRELCALFDLRVTHDEFCALWSAIFPAHSLLPEELFASLARNYRVILLSNTNSIHFEEIRRNYPHLNHFHHYVLSYEVGAAKPSSRIYHAAIEAAQCAAEDCFFTDDIPVYVEGARKQGIDAVQFLNCEQLESELRARGVDW